MRDILGNAKMCRIPYVLPNAKTIHTTSKTEPIPLVCEPNIWKTTNLAAILALGKA